MIAKAKTSSRASFCFPGRVVHCLHMSQTKAKGVLGKGGKALPAPLKRPTAKTGGKPSQTTDLAIVRGELGKIIIDMLHMKEDLAKIASGIVAANNGIAALAQRMNEKKPDYDAAHLGEKIADLKSDIGVLKTLVRQAGSPRSFME